jgi:hypothetical protein
MQFFPSDQIIKSLVKTGPLSALLPSGSYLRIGGLGYALTYDLIMNIDTALDEGSLQPGSRYYIYVCVSSSLNPILVASLSADKPSVFDAATRVGRIDLNLSSEIIIVGTDFLNEVQESQIETIQLGASENATNILSLQGFTTTQLTTLTDINSRLIAVESDMSGVQSLSASNEIEIDALKADSSSHGQSIGEHSAGITNLQSQISSAQGSLSVLNSQKTVLQDELYGAQSLIASHNDRINTLQGQFDIDFGHKHNGRDSNIIKAVDLSGEDGSPNSVLTLNEQGEVEWMPSNLPTHKINSISLQWVEGTASSPTKQNKVSGTALAYSFFAMGIGGSGQRLYASFRVPTEYAPGKKILFSFLSHTSSTNNGMTYQFACTSYLVKPSQAADSSSMSNLQAGQVVIAGSIPEALKVNAFDITSSNGKIAEQSVSPGDLIHVMIEKLNTGTTEDTMATSVLTNGTEVSFNI